MSGTRPCETCGESSMCGSPTCWHCSQCGEHHGVRDEYLLADGDGGGGGWVVCSEQCKDAYQRGAKGATVSDVNRELRRHFDRAGEQHERNAAALKAWIAKWQR